MKVILLFLAILIVSCGGSGRQNPETYNQETMISTDTTHYDEVIIEPIDITIVSE